MNNSFDNNDFNNSDTNNADANNSDSNNADFDDGLASWGASPVPPADPAFAQRLEDDLRSAMYFSPTTDPSASRRRWFARPAVVFGALLLVIGGGIWWGQREDQSVTTVAVDGASNTEVRFADGTVGPATAGQELPDGVRVVVGPDGSAIVDGIVLDAGIEAEIIDGIVEVIGSSTPTPGSAAPTAVPTPTVEQRPAPTTEPRPSPTDGQGADRQRTPVAQPTAAATTAPTPAPIDRPTAQPQPTATTQPTPPAPTPAPSQVPDGTYSIALTLTVEGDRLVLTWQNTNPPGTLRGYEVIAFTGDGQRTVAVIRDAETMTLTVTGHRANGYRIIARGESTVLAESNIAE